MMSRKVPLGCDLGLYDFENLKLGERTKDFEIIDVRLRELGDFYSIEIGNVGQLL